MAHVQREPDNLPRIPEVLLNLLASLIRIAHNKFPPTALPLQHHRVPPFQIECTCESDIWPNHVRLSPISSMVKVHLPHGFGQSRKVPSKRSIRHNSDKIRPNKFPYFPPQKPTKRYVCGVAHPLVSRSGDPTRSRVSPVQHRDCIPEPVQTRLQFPNCVLHSTRSVSGFGRQYQNPWPHDLCARIHPCRSGGWS